jgi:hypothetical protein
MRSRTDTYNMRTNAGRKGGRGVGGAADEQRLTGIIAQELDFRRRSVNPPACDSASEAKPMPARELLTESPQSGCEPVGSDATL